MQGCGKREMVPTGWWIWVEESDDEYGLMMKPAENRERTATCLIVAELPPI
jgi:hypothetical protein